MQRKLYSESVEPNLTEGDTLVFSHGQHPLRLHHPAEGVDVFMVAPKGPATSCAASTSTGAAYPCSSPSRRTRPARLGLALSYAKAIGGLRAGGIKTTFTEETETDLFGEQAVLCGGASQLVQYGFEVLTEAASSPRWRTSSACTSLLIVDLMYEGGIAKQRWSVSDTAEYGDYVSGPRDHPRGEGEHEGSRTSRTASSRSASSTTRTPARRSSRSCARRARSTRSRAPAASSAS